MIVCELVKSLYGSKQAGEIWGSYLDEILKKSGFSSPSLDNCIYLRLEVREFLMLAIVVDDIDLSSNSSRMMKKFKSALSATLSVKLFGYLRSFVGWTTSINGKSIKIDQRSYAKNLVEEHITAEAYAVHTPLPQIPTLHPKERT